MNLFEYTLKIARIEQSATAKELGLICRELAAESAPGVYSKKRWNVAKNTEEYEDDKFEAKALTRAIQCYEEKSSVKLPDYVYNHRASISNRAKEYLLLVAEEYTYEELLDLCQYDTVLNLNSYLPTHRIELLASVVQNKELPFKVGLDMRLTAGEEHRIGKLSEVMQDDVKKYIQLDILDHNMPNTGNYTIINHLKNQYNKENKVVRNTRRPIIKSYAWIDKPDIYAEGYSVGMDAEECGNTFRKTIYKELDDTRAAIDRLLNLSV